MDFLEILISDAVVSAQFSIQVKRTPNVMIFFGFRFVMVVLESMRIQGDGNNTKGVKLFER